MGGIASKEQLRMSFARWALFCVPLILLLGFLSGRSVPAGDNSLWYQALAKPALTPPGWVFPLAWSALYIMLGLALAMIANARGAGLRGMAIGLFVAQFGLNLAWTPLFFGAHRINLAFITLITMLVLAIATTIVFSRIRPRAAWLMVPYLVWISFAAALTWRIGQLNPDAQALVPSARTSQVIG
ncbi:TspO/MBR family protein [Sphingomonas mucosissima]|uniref:TspO/MBR family protein n=2 Tax=Sphingomonas mucosissima TaxID=370959 RepID=A0A245ZFG5_9SPHN|nr:TspO/MBR family protein [Sphingomonas mucosissima]